MNTPTTSQFKFLSSRMLLLQNPRSLMRAGILLLVIVSAWYMYTLVSTTMFMAQKRTYEHDMKQVSSQLAQAEVDFMHLTESLSPDDIAEYGFKIAHAVHFVGEGTSSTNVAYANR
jgi:hypothetical protein